MKVSAIITFILMLLLGTVGFVFSMDMPSVLDSASFFIGYFIVVVILAVISFVLVLLNKSKMFSITNIVSLVLILILFFIGRAITIADYEVHRTLMESNTVVITATVTLLINTIMSIINIILGFKEK